MTYQFTCYIATLWTFTANIRLHTFMSKYVLGWCSVILIVDTANIRLHTFMSKYELGWCSVVLIVDTANTRLHTFMSKYVLGWYSVILIVDTPWHPHYQFQSLRQMNCLHIHAITNISARVNNCMLTVIAVHNRE